MWLLGSGRSGSTWLLNLLRESGDVVGVDEPLIGAHLAVPMSAVSSSDEHDRLVYDASRGRRQYVFSDAQAAVWRPALRGLVLDRLAAETDGRGRATVVVKEPNGSLAAPLLLSLTPGARLLFLVRDGRDVVDSSIDAVTSAWATGEQRPPLDGADRLAYLERRAHLWVASTDAVRRAYDAHDPDRRLLVTYETLRGNTGDELTRILRWIGLPVDPAAVEAATARLAFEALPDESRGEGRFARAATPGLWRERFSADEQAVLADILGPALNALGYPPG